MLTFSIVSFSKLVKLFYFCKYFFVLCFILLLGVSFKFKLVPFWGCLSFVLHAFVCFIGSFKLFRTKLSRLFVYPLIKLLDT
jgi:hypothetical protein